jgi:dTDP-4-dehydrorhamnose reductase
MRIVLGDGLLGSAIVGVTGWQYVSRSKDGIDFRKGSWKQHIPIGTTEIINMIANTDTYSDNWDDMFDVNYRAVIELVDFCNAKGIKLIHYSTDYVYVNNAQLPRETHKPKPQQTPYAISKLLADEYIIKHCKNYLILRGSQKPDPFPYEKAFVDVIGNFDYPDVIAAIVMKMVRYEATGIYNIGTEAKSVHDLAIETNPMVQETKAPDHFPKDLRMDLSKMKQFLDGKEEDHDSL